MAKATTVQTRYQALIRFQGDLVNRLARRTDAQSLLAAALLARTLPGQPEFKHFHTLLQRATHADGTGAALYWLQLADCDAAADTCPNSAALHKLAGSAADNAAFWILKMGLDIHDNKAQLAERDLHHAALAKFYDDYAGDSLQALARNVTALAPPAAALDPHAKAGAFAVQTMLVFGIASYQPQPILYVVAKLCDKDARPHVKKDCMHVSNTLVSGSSPLARSLGLHVREVLASPAQQQEAKRAWFDLVWQIQHFAALLAQAQNNQALARRLLRLARHSGTEMSIILAALRHEGMASHAPAAWQPPRAHGPASAPDHPADSKVTAKVADATL